MRFNIHTKCGVAEQQEKMHVRLTVGFPLVKVSASPVLRTGLTNVTICLLQSEGKPCPQVSNALGSSGARRRLKKGLANSKYNWISVDVQSEEGTQRRDVETWACGLNLSVPGRACTGPAG